MNLFRRDRPLTAAFDLIRPSVKLLIDNIWPTFYLSFLPTLLTVVGIVLMGKHGELMQVASHWDNRQLTGLAMTLAGLFWTILTYPAMLIVKIQAVMGTRLDATDAFKRGLPRLLPFIGVSILIGLSVGIGFIMLVIPGLLALRGFFLAQYYIVDQPIGVMAALRQSYADSRPNAGYIWGTIGVQCLIGIVASGAGSLPVVGYLLSLVVNYIYFFAPAIRYCEIAHNYQLPITASEDS